MAAHTQVTVGFVRALPLALTLLFACRGEPPPLVTLPELAPKSVVFRRVAVLDVASGISRPSLDVVVSDARIAAIGSQGTVAVPAGAFEVDGGGATLVPGLVDSHGHLGNGSAPPWAGEFPDPERNLQSYLYCGITTVLDPADLASKAFTRRDAVAARKLLGPAIYAAGPMLTAPAGHPIPAIEALAPWWLAWYVKRDATRTIDSPEDARRAVAELARSKPDFVKLSVDSIPESAPRLRKELIAAVIDEAHRAGLRAIAHIGSYPDALDAGQGHIDALMHLIYKDRISAEQAALIAAFHVPMVATIGVFESYALLGQRKREPTDLEVQTVPQALLASFDTIPAGAVGPDFLGYFEALRSMRRQWRDNVRLLREAGVTILAGSDTQSGVFPGPGLHRELALLVETGMTPAQVIRAATLDGARFLTGNDDPDFGTVAVGKRADLLLVEGNPAFNISALTRIRTVMKNGVVLERHPISHP